MVIAAVVLGCNTVAGQYSLCAEMMNNHTWSRGQGSSRTGAAAAVQLVSQPLVHPSWWLLIVFPTNAGVWGFGSADMCRVIINARRVFSSSSGLHAVA